MELEINRVGWFGLNWLRIRTGGGTLVNMIMNLYVPYGGGGVFLNQPRNHYPLKDSAPWGTVVHMARVIPEIRPRATFERPNAEKAVLRMRNGIQKNMHTHSCKHVLSLSLPYQLLG
jgi:hypothetical protein